MSQQLSRRTQQFFLLFCVAAAAHAQLTPADAVFAGLSARTSQMAYQARGGDMTVIAPLMADFANSDRVHAYRSLTHAQILMDGKSWTPDAELATGLDFQLGSKIIGAGEELTASALFLFDAPAAANGPYRLKIESPAAAISLGDIAGRKAGDKVKTAIHGLTPGVHLIHAQLVDGHGVSLYDYYRTVVVLKDVSARTAALEKTLAALPDQQTRAALTARQVLETIQQAHQTYFVQGFQALTGFVYTRMRTVNLGSAEALDYEAALTQAMAAANAAKAGKDPFASATGEVALAYRSAFDGKLVPYRAYIPTNYDKSKKYALLVMLHGAGGNETDFLTGYRKQFPEFAEKRGYIVVAVNGRGPLSGYTKASGGQQDVLDVAELMQKNYSIDSSRVYLGGHSMGGGGTWAVGLLYPDRWAGLIPIAGSNATTALAGYETHLKSAAHKLPVMMVCGVKDALVAVAGCRTLAEHAAALHAPLKYAEYADGDHLSVVAMAVPAIFDWLDAQAKGGPVSEAALHPTFSKDVAPILYEKCISCHRAGDIAPMELRTYQQVRPWAKSIQEQVVKRSMPPWFADPQYGKFRNDRHLSEAEIKTISAWVAAGAPEGNPKDLPQLPKMAEGWSFDRPPDLVVEMPLTVKIPAEGQLDMMNYYTPVPFKEERWVEAVELRPGNRQVVHHSIVNIVKLPPGLTQEQLTSGKKLGGLGWKLIGQAPGKGAERHTDGVAKRIAPGAYFEFNMHYTPTGKPETDRSLLGLWFAKGPIHHEVVTRPAMEQTLLGGKVVSRRELPKIPAGDPNWAIDGQMTVKEDITLYSLSPHMHFRGHDMKYTVRYPDGREEVLLNVPHYDFEWQLNYEFEHPVKVPAGSTFIVNGHFDNSKNNLKNPDPTADVIWGQQSWNEMFIPWAEWSVDKVDLTTMTTEEIDKMRNTGRVRDPEIASSGDKKN